MWPSQKYIQILREIKISLKTKIIWSLQSSSNQTILILTFVERCIKGRMAKLANKFCSSWSLFPKRYLHLVKANFQKVSTRTVLIFYTVHYNQCSDVFHINVHWFIDVLNVLKLFIAALYMLNSILYNLSRIHNCVNKLFLIYHQLTIASNNYQGRMFKMKHCFLT